MRYIQDICNGGRRRYQVLYFMPLAISFSCAVSYVRTLQVMCLILQVLRLQEHEAS